MCLRTWATQRNAVFLTFSAQHLAKASPLLHLLTHFSASVCCSLMPTLKWTGCTLSSMPLWISRGNASNMVPGSGMRTLKPSRFPVMMGNMSGAELPVAWVTWKSRKGYEHADTEMSCFSLIFLIIPEQVKSYLISIETLNREEVNKCQWNSTMK